MLECGHFVFTPHLPPATHYQIRKQSSLNERMDGCGIFEGLAISKALFS